MIELFDTALPLIHQGGLSGLWDTIRTDWLGPIVLAAIAIFAIIFIKDRAWLKLIGFVGIAAIVSVLVFAGENLFGESGNLKGVAEGFATDIENTIVVDNAPALGSESVLVLEDNTTR